MEKKYTDDFIINDYTKGPYPRAHSINGELVPPDGDAHPRMTGGVLKKETDDLAIGLSYGPEGHQGDLGPYIQRCGEGLPNSFTLDFTNPVKFSACHMHSHTAILIFALALNMRPQVIVETGTMFGFSTTFLAKCCEIWGEGKVYTIDTMGGDRVDASIRESPYVECITGYSTKVLPGLMEQLGEVHFALLDSWKRLSYKEFLQIEPYMAEGGIFAFHDTQFLNTGEDLYNKIMANFADKYETMLFDGLAHKDNGHKFFGNADDRGLFVIRKKNSIRTFLDVKDTQSAMYRGRCFE